MTKSEMIQAAKESTNGNYDGDKIAAIIEAGILPEGVLYNDGENKLVKNGNTVEAYVNDKLDKVTELDAETTESLLVMYAAMQGQISVGTGVR